MEEKQLNEYKISSLKTMHQQHQQIRKQSAHKSKKNRLIALLLCIFLGYFAGHRFYVGKNGSAILQIILVFCGGLGFVWVLFDLLMIICGKFTDKHDKVLMEWS